MKEKIQIECMWLIDIKEKIKIILKLNPIFTDIKYRRIGEMG